MEEKVVGGRYKIRSKIGAGSFGEVYMADDLKEHIEVAVKINLPKDRTSQLSFESKVYSILQGAINIPRFFSFGSVTYNSKNEYMAIELLGESVQTKFVRCGRKLSLKTVLIIADQMLTSIQYLHTRHFIHRDLKPDNFVFGVNTRTNEFGCSNKKDNDNNINSHCNNSKNNQIYLIDFGLAKKFRDSKTLEHIQYNVFKEMAGTARYSSVNVLKGVEQSRRDDMESLGYIFIYLLKGFLPWMGIADKDRNRRNAKILRIKKQISLEELCKDLPEEFHHYLETVRKLKFAEEPNYSSYRKIFRKLFMKMDFVYDYKYDWVEDKKVEISENSIAVTLNLAKTPKLKNSNYNYSNNSNNFNSSNNSPLENKNNNLLKVIKSIPTKKPSFYDIDKSKQNLLNKTPRFRLAHIKMSKEITLPKVALCHA